MIIDSHNALIKNSSTSNFIIHYNIRSGKMRSWQVKRKELLRLKRAFNLK